MDGVLVLTFSGWGDRGFIDTFGSDEPSIHLCSECATALRTKFPVTNVIDPHLNINYTHVCEARNNEFVNEPLPSCSADPDLHGWRRVYLVRPECTCGPNRMRGYSVWDKEEDAHEAAREYAMSGHPSRISEQLLGNMLSYTLSPPPGL